MEESLVFQVDHQEESEDEDDIARKEELQRLLTEELCDDLLEDSEEEEVTFYSPPPSSHLSPHITSNNYLSSPMRVSHWQTTPTHKQTTPTHLNEHSDVFTGTSQAYTDDVIMTSQYESGPNLPVNLVAKTSPTTISEVTPDLYSHLNREQMEVLYNSKCNQMKELEQTMSLFQHEQEKKLGILRHLNRQLEAEKYKLTRDLTEKQNQFDELMKKVDDLEGVNERKDEVEKEREDLAVQLGVAQATIQSLTIQLSDLNQSDALQRLRQNYETALTSSNEQYRTELNQLKEELSVARQQLEQNKENVTNHFQTNDQSLLQAQSHSSYNSSENLEEERRDLIAQIEDLRYQLSTSQEQLLVSEQKIKESESVIQEWQMLQERTGREQEEKEEKLRQQIKELQTQIDTHQVMAEMKLKTSLEQCRSTCLKLHEDSTGRLKEELLEEKRKLELQYQAETTKLRKEVGTLQSKLVTTQQQLVEVNDKKETETTDTMKLREHIKKLQIELESLHKTQTGSLQDVVDNLKKEWEKEEKTKIVSAIETARAGWMKERESEWKNRLDTAISAAHKLWKKEEDERRQEAIHVALQQVQEEHNKILTGVKLNKEKEIVKLKEEIEAEKQKMSHELKRAENRYRQATKKTTNLEGVVQELKETLKSLKTSIVDLMATTLAEQEQKCQQQVKRVRETTLKEAEQHYLSCLHELVNYSKK